MKSLTSIAVISLLPGLALATDGCQFDPPPVIERIFAQAAARNLQSLGDFTIGSLAFPKDPSQLCPHGVDTRFGACCWMCSRGQEAKTVTPRDSIAMQTALSRMSETVADSRSLSANIQTLMKDPPTKATLDMIDYYVIRTDNQDAFRKAFVKEIAAGGTKYNKELASLVLQVFPDETQDPWHLSKGSGRGGASAFPTNPYEEFMIAATRLEAPLIRAYKAAQPRATPSIKPETVLKFSLLRIVVHNYRLKNKPFANALVAATTLSVARSRTAAGKAWPFTIPPIKTDSIPPGGRPK